MDMEEEDDSSSKAGPVQIKLEKHSGIPTVTFGPDGDEGDGDAGGGDGDGRGGGGGGSSDGDDGGKQVQPTLSTVWRQ